MSFLNFKGHVKMYSTFHTNRGLLGQCFFFSSPFTKKKTSVVLAGRNFCEGSNNNKICLASIWRSYWSPRIDHVARGTIVNFNRRDVSINFLKTSAKFKPQIRNLALCRGMQGGKINTSEPVYSMNSPNLTWKQILLFTSIHKSIEELHRLNVFTSILKNVNGLSPLMLYVRKRFSGRRSGSGTYGKRILKLPSKPIGVLKPILFTVLVVCSSFGLAAWYEKVYVKNSLFEKEGTRKFFILKEDYKKSPIVTVTRVDTVYNDQGGLMDILHSVKEIYWNNTVSAYRTCLVITFINASVYLAWKVPILQKFMHRNFLHVPSRSPLRTLITSAFSHKSILHIAANTFVLFQFGPLFGQLFYPASQAYFIAYYISTCTISSLAQHLFSYTALGAASFGIGSLGASGAVWAILSGLAYIDPHARISVILFPFTSFELWQACLGLVALDIIGLFRKNSLFSHSAHLGGAISGYVITNLFRKYQYDPRRPSFRPPPPPPPVHTQIGRYPWA